MFNQFEGNEDGRAAKLQERLEILKRAHQDGFFNEEGAETITEVLSVPAFERPKHKLGLSYDELKEIAGTALRSHERGVNPCDPDHGLIFTGEDPEPKSGVFKRPMGMGEAERKLRGLCPQCGGHGDLLMYGDSLARCPSCGGTGQDNTRSCLVCGGEGRGVHGQACPHCGGRGLEPA